MARKEAPLPGKAQLLALYRTMLTIRRTEEQLVKAYASGLIYGACHTYIGEEAVATGVCAHLRQDDVILSTHRGHGHALAKGVAPRALIAELFGRATGCSGGRGGSMHLFAPEVGLLGTSGIVSASITQATGAAYAFKPLKTDRVSVAFFGDGAANQGPMVGEQHPASVRVDPVGVRIKQMFCGDRDVFFAHAPAAQDALHLASQVRLAEPAPRPQSEHAEAGAVQQHRHGPKGARSTVGLPDELQRPGRPARLVSG